MRTSSAGLQLIEQFEGLRLSAYQDSVGVWTIGYGSATTGGFNVYPGLVITQAQAEEWLSQELSTTESYINSVVTQTISQKMFDALVSFTYNVGQGNLAQSSVLRLLNLGDFQSAANAFLLWNRAGGIVLQGLTNRRTMERALFLQGVADLQGSNAPVTVDTTQETVPVTESTPTPDPTPEQQASPTTTPTDSSLDQATIPAEEPETPSNGGN